MATFSIRNPYFIVVCALVLCLIGGTVVARMPVDLFPNLDLTVVVVATLYPGMPPEQVEKNITERQERFFTLAPGIDHIESRSITGAAIIKTFFQPGTNPEGATSTMASLAAAEMRRMPPGTLPPYIIRFDASSLPVCLVALKADGLTEAALRDIGHYRVRTQVAKVPGAAVPPPFGGRYRQIMVYVDPAKLDSQRLSAMDVVRAINESNIIMPSGTIRIGPIDYPIYTNSQFTDLEGVTRLPIRTNGNTQVTVGDVAQVRDAAQIQYNVVRVDGQPSVYQPVLRQGGNTNTISVVDAVKKEIANLLDVPDNLVARVVFDQSLFIKNAIRTLINEGAIGVVLTSIMILLFLGSFRATSAVFFSIPLSALAALIALALLGGSVNSMTLGGLALAFSRLIDNSVVVLENIFRRMDLGDDAREAAEKGTQEVALPVLASTLTTAVVFLPVVFLYGVSRDLFTALALTVVLSLFASYVVAMTVVPLFCARFIKPFHPHTHAEHDKAAHSWFFYFNRWFLKLMTLYDEILTVVLFKPALTVTALLAAFVLSLLYYPNLGVAFFPRTDAGQFVINMKAPLGSNLEIMEAKVARVEQMVREVVPSEEYEMMVSNTGVVPDFSAIYTSNSSPHTAFLQVSLKPKHKVSSFEYMDRMRKRLRTEMPELNVYFQTGSFVDAVLNFGMPAPIDVQVSGPDLPSIFQVATTLAPRIRDLPGVSDILIPQDLDTPALRIDVDRSRAAMLGLSQREIASNVITSLASNSMIAPTYWTDPKSGNDYYLTVQYPERTVKTVDAIRSIPLKANGASVTSLDAVATVGRVGAPTEVAHYGLRKVVDIYVNLENEDLGRLASKIEDLIAQTKLPKGVRIDLRGSVNGMRESFRSFGLGLVLSVLLLYLILVAQFRSFLDPVLILLAVPMGLIGVLMMLYHSATTMNVQSLMGVVMMVGIVVSNSILLVDFTRRMQNDGMELKDAVSMAARVRLRPILMTSLATIIGLMPMALRIGEGSEAYAPLARAVIGGMSMSLVLTVFIVPAAYVVAYRRPGAR
ncbi:MAG: efflux RND transporter permease subunit [Candidatus Solibacter usitatus]|nr:efflux RND transporter permease subunit [Candidatus Solibacter usitatus]